MILSTLGTAEHVDASAGASGSASITVPSDCTLVIIQWDYHAPVSIATSFAIDGVNFNLDLNIGSSGDIHAHGSASLQNPSVGSQSLSWVWGDAPLEGGGIIVTYIKGELKTAPIRDTDGQAGDMAANVTATVTSITTDLVIAYCSSEATPVLTGGDGESLYFDNSTVNARITDAAELTAGASTTVADMTGEAYGAIVAVSIISASRINGIYNTDFVIDFIPESAVDPYTHPKITNIDSTAELATNGAFNEFVPNGSGDQRFRYNVSATKDIIVSSIEIAQGNGFDRMGPAIFAPNGEGYLVSISFADNFTLDRIDAGGTTTDIGGSEEQPASGFTAGDRMHLTLTVSTGHLQVHSGSGEQLFSVIDNTYSTNLAPGMYFDYGGNGSGIASFSGNLFLAKNSPKIGPVVIPRPWTRQPPAGIPIDLSHPLARGLVAAFVPRENEWYDVLGFHGIVPVDSGTVLTEFTRHGRAVSYNATDGVHISATGNNPYLLQPVNDITMLTVWQLPPDSNEGGFRHMLAVRIGFTNIYGLLNNATPSGREPTFLVNNTISATDITLAVTDRWLQSQIGRWSAGETCSIDVYNMENQTLFGTATSVSTISGPLAYQTSGAGMVYEFGGNNNVRHNSYLNLVWDRKLSDAEARDVALNPWQIFKPRSIRIGETPDLELVTF